MTGIDVSHSVIFNDSNENFIFDLVFTDGLLIENTPGGDIEVFLPHDISANTADASAQLFVPINYFQDLFLIKMTQQDISDDTYENAKFAVDSSKWSQQSYVIPFHNAIVDNSSSIKPNVRYDKRNIQYDFIRSVYLDLTGNLMFSSIFNNTEQLLNRIEEIDRHLTEKIKEKLSQIGGTETNPYDISNNISNNPSRDFLLGILSAPQTKIYRKQKLVKDLSDNFDKGSSDTSFVSLPFHYGDGIRMKLEYHHYNGYFANRKIHPRSYIVTMFLSLQTKVDVSFQDISSSIQIDNGEAQLNGEYYLEMLWLGSEDRSSYSFSQYNYYPYFRHINSLTLSMNVLSVDGSGAAFVFYGRPRVYTDTTQDLYTKQDVSMDKIEYFIQKSDISHGTLREYTEKDFKVIVNDNITYDDIETFLETEIDIDVSFTPFFEYYGNQQILSLGIGGTNLNCNVKEAIIGTSDGRTITLS